MLSTLDCSEQQIEETCGNILVAKPSQQPLTQLQKVMCDADFYYLEIDDFFEISDNLRKEGRIDQR
ncbi:MAG: hypothetical protein ACLFT3_05930 [Cyclobacteriaceae bacterium]